AHRAGVGHVVRNDVERPRGRIQTAQALLESHDICSGSDDLLDVAKLEYAERTNLQVRPIGPADNTADLAVLQGIRRRTLVAAAGRYRNPVDSFRSRRTVARRTIPDVVVTAGLDVLKLDHGHFQATRILDREFHVIRPLGRLEAANRTGFGQDHPVPLD